MSPRRSQEQRLQGATDRPLVVEQQGLGEPDARRLPRRRGPAAQPLADGVAVQRDRRRSVLTNCTSVGLGVAAERVAAVGERADPLERRHLLVREQCHGAHPHRRRPGWCCPRPRGYRISTAPRKPGWPWATGPTGNSPGVAVGESGRQGPRCCRWRPLEDRRRRLPPGASRSRSRWTLPSASSKPGRRVRRRPAGPRHLGDDGEAGHRHRPSEVHGDACQADIGERVLERPDEEPRSADHRGRRRGPRGRGRVRLGCGLTRCRRHGARW